MNNTFDIYVGINRFYRLQKQTAVKWRIFGTIIPGESILNQVEGRRGMNLRHLDFMYRNQ